MTDSSAPQRRERLLPVPLAAALLFLSGAAGLLYEVVWFRRLHLVLGVSVFAVGAVVAAFMLGLALGSRWAANAPAIRRQPLLAYARLEIGIGLYAVASPWLIAGVERLYTAATPLVPESFVALTLLRFVLSLAVLLPPTFLMGATLPALAEAAVAQARNVAGAVGVLYAVNTIGGMAGTLLAGFYALEHLGISGSLRLGLLLNVVVAAGAWLAHRRGLAPRAPAPDDAPTTDAGTPALSMGVVGAVVFGTGCISMAQEIVWTRALVFFVHNSTYAFSAILATYLFGLSVGAGIGARVASRVRRPDVALAGTLLLFAATSVLAIGVYRHLPVLAEWVLGNRLAPGMSRLVGPDVWVVSSWATALAAILTQVAAVLLLPTLAAGAVFPLALAARAGSGAAPARLVGRLVAINTVGCVLGTLLGTFALVPLFGTRLALLLLAWLLLPVAWIVLARRRARGPLAIPLGAAASLAIFAFGFLAAPAGMYRALFEHRFGHVLWFSEGVSETVAICRRPDGVAWIHYSDGRGASGTTSYRGGWLYAHLPLLFHADPRSAMVVCFGTGNTLGAASLHDLDRLDGVELSTEIVDASFIFEETNHAVATNEDVNVIIDDGRNYILRTPHRYDVITEEPPLVHTAGVVNLYSKDFYELCRDRLTEDGIVAVWLATWELNERETKMLARAFLDVFPHATIWDSMHHGEWILIGSKKPLRFDVDALRARMSPPAIRADLEKIGLFEPADVLSLYLKGPEFLRAFTADVPPVTDDRSVVDYTIPRHARSNFGLGETLTGGLRAVGASRSGSVSDAKWQAFDRMYVDRDDVAALVAETGDVPRDSFLVAVGERQHRREIDSARTLAGTITSLAQDQFAAGHPRIAMQTLEDGMALVPAPATADLIAMGAFLHLQMGNRRMCEAALRKALDMDPGNRVAAQVADRLRATP